MSNSGFLRPVRTEEDIAQVSALGRRIWTEHYTPFLPAGQVPYMLEHFHSEAIVRTEIAEKGYEYFLVHHDGSEVGYLGFVDEGDSIYLSKLYLGAEARGSGIGKRALGYVRDQAVARGHRAIRLGVHKKNSGTIAAYERIGFKITDEMVTDIGGGYVMDDYAMEWVL